MKYKINKAAYDALSDEQKALYKLEGDTATLQIEGLPQDNSAELQSQIDTLTASMAELKGINAKLVKDAKASTTKAAREAGDVEALEASWQEKLTATENTYKGKLDGANAQIQKLMVDSAADSLASKLAGPAAAVLLPHIKSRIALEQDATTGEYKTRIMKDGKPSAMTIADLEGEFRANDAFKSVLVAPQSAGTGGGKSDTPGAFKPSVQGADGKPLSMLDQAKMLAAQLPQE